jgi:uncharacterized protein (TIGR01244 family)
MRRRIVGVVTAVAAAAVTACSGAPATPQVQKVDAPGIRNFSRLDSNAGFGGPTVGFGGATDPSAMAWLKSEGFVSVINLRFATEEGVNVDSARAAAQAAGLDYIHMPFSSRDADPQVVGDFLAAVGDEGNQPVYIHCGSATRVAALWMIQRVLEDGWEIDDARAEAEAIALKPEEAVAFATQYLASREDY